jgi:hypothetical protein
MVIHDISCGFMYLYIKLQVFFRINSLLRNKAFLFSISSGNYAISMIAAVKDGNI